MRRIRRAVGAALGVSLYLAAGVLMVPWLVLAMLLNWLVQLTPGGSKTFFAPRLFPWTTELEADWSSIRAELDAVARDLESVPNYQDLSAAQRQLSQDDKWKSFIFLVFGTKIERNCDRCPETVRALERIPGLCYAMFSILKPHKHIPAHRGPYRGLLNCHLALAVPNRSACRLRVGPDVEHWEEGRMLIFDDFNPHEAWNDSDRLRAVLLMYVARPLPFPLCALNRFLLRTAPWTFYARSLVRQANRGAEVHLR